MRIASLSPAITEILYALELQDHLVCVDAKTSFPEEVSGIAHLLKSTILGPKDIVQHETDIVFVSGNDYQDLEIELLQRGVQMVRQNPKSLDEIYESITSIGLLMQVESRAEDVILSMKQTLNGIKKKAGLLPKKLRVYSEYYNDPPTVCNNWILELISIAGGMPFTKLKEREFTTVSNIDIESFDPDLIVIHWKGTGLHPDVSELHSRQNWQQLRAIQDKHIRIVDDSFANIAGPRVIEYANRLYGWLFELQH